MNEAGYSKTKLFGRIEIEIIQKIGNKTKTAPIIRNR